MTNVIDNIKLLNDKRHINAIALLKDTKNGIVQDKKHPNLFGVMSSKTGTYYEVSFLNVGAMCGCMDYVQHGHKNGFECKHIQAVKILQKQKHKFIEKELVF